MANSNLVREKRPDVNGKMVTRLVKADAAKTTSKAAMPAPTVGTKKAAKKTAFKPRPDQLEQKERKLVFARYPHDEELRTDHNHHPWHKFTASDVEMFEVFGTVNNVGNALKMLHEGVRTAEGAKEYLEAADAGHLFVDRSDLTEAAIRKNLHPSDFLDYSAFIKDHHKGSDVVDGVLYSISPLAENNSYEVQRDIFEGLVSYDHIKQIGWAKLKPIGRLGVMHGTLKKLASGEGNYTVDDIKELIQRASTARIEPEVLEHVVRVMDGAGYDVVRRTSNLRRISTAFGYYRDKVWRNQYDEASLFQRVTDCLEVTALADPAENGWSIYAPDEYLEAGMSLEFAAEALRNNWDLEQAQVRHDAIKVHGISGNLAEGWL